MKIENYYGWNDSNLKLSPHMLCHIRHHINNPLTIMLLMLQSKKKLSRVDLEKQARAIADYVRSLERYVKEEVNRKKFATCE